MRANRSIRRRRRRPQLWNQLRDELERDLKLTRTSWPAVQAGCAELAPFAEATDAVAWFHERGMLDEKDRAYHHLIGVVHRGDGKARRLARALVWLGLWPGLDHRFGEDVRSGVAADEEVNDLVEDYAAAFLRVLRNYDASAVRRVASTIIKSTARDARELGAPPSAANIGADTASPPSIAMVSDSFDLVLLHRELAAIVGDDAQLVVLATVVGLSYVEIGGHLNIRPNTVNQRILRAMARLRTTKSNVHKSFLSGFASKTRVSLNVSPNSVRCPNHAPGSDRPLATKQVGTSRYCDECADFLLAGTVRHARGTSCLVSGDDGDGICPACLVDVFRARGELS